VKSSYSARAVELVPSIVDGVDLGIVGPPKVAFELQIVRRVGEDEVGRGKPATHSSRQCNRLDDAVDDL